MRHSLAIRKFCKKKSWRVFTLIHPTFVQTLAGFVKRIALYFGRMSHVLSNQKFTAAKIFTFLEMTNMLALFFSIKFVIW